MSEPMEWWIYGCRHFHYPGGLGQSHEIATVTVHNPEGETKEEIVHVIERCAYDQQAERILFLERELEVLRGTK